MAKTFIPKKENLDQKCFLIDAENQILGRLATKVAMLLTGKDECFYTPHMICGDQVVVINAKGIKVTGRKEEQKTYDRYTGYAGGRKVIAYKKLLAEHPDRIIEEAVKGMLPKNRLRAKMLKRLHIYPGPDHRQAAQKPIPTEVK